MNSNDLYKNNPYQKYEALFEDWPLAQALPVRDEYGMRIAVMHATPDKYKMAHNLTLVSVAVLGAFFAWCFYSIYPDVQYYERYGAEFWAWALTGSWMLMSFFAWRTFIDRALATTKVSISPNYIEINGRVYDAKVQHNFTMDLHRRAMEEERAEELAERRAQQRGTRPVWRHFRYYRDSYQIYFEYLGQRTLVTDVYGTENAERLLRGLTAMDRIIHKEKTVFAANTNAHSGSNGPSTLYGYDLEESPGARSERQGHLGKRPALD